MPCPMEKVGYGEIKPMQNMIMIFIKRLCAIPASPRDHFYVNRFIHGMISTFQICESPLDAQAFRLRAMPP